MWLVVATMCSGKLIRLTLPSVGYGDFYPRSHWGRFIIIFATFWGVFLISMCIVSVANYRNFYSTEKLVQSLKHKVV